MIAVVIDRGDLLALAAVALAVVALALVLGWPRAVALVALASGMLQYGPTKTAHLVPEAFTVLDDFLVVALGLRWLMDVVARRVSPLAWATTWLLIWMGVGVMTAVARGIGFMTVVMTYRWLFLPMILYLVCAHYARHDGFPRSVIRVVIGIALFQAALAVIQAGLARSIGDSAYGLLGPGGANALGFIILLAVVLVAASNKPLSTSAWLVALGILGVIAAQSRAAILAAPFALVVAYRARLKRPLVALAVAAIVVAFGFIVAVAFEKSHMSVSQDLSPQFLVANQLDTPNHGGGRLIPVQRLPGLLGATPLGWVAGLGPGQYGSAFRQIPSMLAYTYSVANSEWTVIWGEFGLIGLVCLVAILARPVLISRRLGTIDGPDWTRQVARAAPSIVLAGAVGMIVLTILEYQPFSYPLWASLGLVEGAYFVRRKEQR